MENDDPNVSLRGWQSGIARCVKYFDGNKSGGCDDIDNVANKSIRYASETGNSHVNIPDTATFLL